MLIHFKSPCSSGNQASSDPGRWFDVDESRGILRAIRGVFGALAEAKNDSCRSSTQQLRMPQSNGLAIRIAPT
jgi:hypothetical protein